MMSFQERESGEARLLSDGIWTESDHVSLTDVVRFSPTKILTVTNLFRH